MKILVVDDEQLIRKLVKDFLVKKNYEVTEAVNGREALEKFYSDNILQNRSVQRFYLRELMRF